MCARFSMTSTRRPPSSGKLPGTDSPGKTGADNDGVVVFDGDIAEIGVINGHNGFSPSYSLMRMGRRRSGASFGGYCTQPASDGLQTPYKPNK